MGKQQLARASRPVTRANKLAHATRCVARRFKGDGTLGTGRCRTPPPRVSASMAMAAGTHIPTVFAPTPSGSVQTNWSANAFSQKKARAPPYRLEIAFPNSGFVRVDTD